MSRTNEKAFEAYIEDVLLGESGWRQGSASEWDKGLALFPAQVCGFIEETQPTEWGELSKLHGSDLKASLMSTLVKELDSKGTLHILRHGFKFYGKTLRMAYFKPVHGANEDVVRLYGMNRMSVTRQIPCHPNDSSTIDMLLSVNGLPVATIELKNPATGQTWRDAVRQYKEDRLPGAPLFSFKKRAMVHFAVDPDEVHMTTHLKGDKTFFLPFNRGSHPGAVRCGAGNPQHSSGHRTAYFWEDILRVDSWMDILGRFMFVEKREDREDDGSGKRRRVEKERMVFPRYHQLDCVRKLTTAARQEGSGHNYLIQHSAGSGKTNSISWLSHQLSSLHDEAEKKIFDCVLVITDRQVLDRQLQDAVYQIEHAQGVVQTIDEDSKQLAGALVDNTKIVVTTLQKFPFVLRGLLRVAGAASVDDPTEEDRRQAKEWQDAIAKRRYAVIVDEAHSSQTGESARELKAILGRSAKDAAAKGEDREEPDWEDRLNQVMKSRGRQPNISFFAFTATPKGKTLEIFGRKGVSGKPESFHIYSMRQAIEEGFILDVVRNYTTYKVYFKLVKEIEDDPSFPKKKAARALAKFMSLHPHNLEQKTEIIIEHFRRHIMSKLGGRAKAMVVTSSRLHAVRYMRVFKRYLAENGYSEIRPLVAFSGTVKDSDTGEEYTEPGMNIDCVNGKNISERQLPERFKSPDYQILLVANKYQTGFDQPLLMAMYVDKRLDGVQAVQTLSRLNRMLPGKETPFVLDFVNESEDIYRAFKPYYDATSLQEAADPQQLENMKNQLDATQVYHWSEVEAFSKVFYKIESRQEKKDNAELAKWIQPSRDRFNALEGDEKKEEFKDRLGSYLKTYAFLSQVMPYCDSSLEMLYSFGSLLLPYLGPVNDSIRVKFDNEVELQYYRMQRIHSGVIDLREEEANGVKSPVDVGTGRAEDKKERLSEIISILNDRFGTSFTEEDRLFFEQIREKAAKNDEVVKLKQSNPFDKFQLGLKALVAKLMIQRMSENDKIVVRYMDDKDFERAAFAILSRAIYDSIPAKSTASSI